MQSNLLPVADAIVLRLAEVIAPTFPLAEVMKTCFDTFDAKDSTGLKVYVWPVADEPGPRADGGNRHAQPLKYYYAVTFVERIPSNVQGPDDRNAWVWERVELVGRCRAALDDPRQYFIPGMAPVDSSPRSSADLEELNQKGIFFSGFELTIREDA